MTESAYGELAPVMEAYGAGCYAAQSLESFLRLLLVLTAADIRAVGPGRWNAWKGGILRELYYRAEEVLTGGHEAEGKAARVVAAQDALRVTLDDWLGEDIGRFTGRLFPP